VQARNGVCRVNRVRGGRGAWTARTVDPIRNALDVFTSNPFERYIKHGRIKGRSSGHWPQASSHQTVHILFLANETMRLSCRALLIIVLYYYIQFCYQLNP